MKKSLSGMVISLIILAAFATLDINQRGIASAATPSRAIRQDAPLTLSQLEELIRNRKDDGTIANDIQRSGIAFTPNANQLTNLKKIGAGPKTIRELRARIKKVVKSSGQTPPQADPNKVIILIADFDGPNPQEYRVTEHIIEQLKAATSKYPDISVLPLAQSITVHQGGSKVARDIGMKRNASIVLWGWYAANTEAVSIHTYFEVLREPKLLSISQNIEKQIATISELRGFKIQTKLSGEMTYLALLTVGLARYESEDYDGAIDRFTTAIAQSDVPDQMVSPADIYIYRGNAYYYKAGVNDIDRAIADFNKAIEIKPDDAYAYGNRGTLHYYKGEYDRAIVDFDQALKLTPDHVVIYINRGAAYYNKGEYDRAIADHDKAIKLKPDFAAAYNNRGAAYHYEGEYDRAIADYDKAIKLKADYAEAYSNRGAAYNQKGQYDRAIADYDKTIKLKPNLADAYFNRGTAYHYKGEYDRAIADYDQAIKLKPDLADAYNNRGTIHNSKGDYDRAIADFDQTIKLKPDYAKAYNNRGIAYDDKGEYDRAIADYDKAIKLKPDFAEAYYNRALAYQLKGERDRAVSDLNHVLQITNDPKLRQDAQERLQKLSVK